MLLLTGERITATHFRPSPMAVAMHLARLPRFGGGLRDDCDHWSVLHHSFLVARIATKSVVNHGNGTGGSWIELASLMHDATEIATGDIPAPFKSAEARHLERHLFRQLCTSWGISFSTGQMLAIKKADNLALLVEAKRVAVPGLLDLVVEENGLAVFPKEGHLYADYIERLLEYGATTGTRDALVSMYRNRVYHLLRTLNENPDSGGQWGLPADPHGKMYP